MTILRILDQTEPTVEKKHFLGDCWRAVNLNGVASTKQNLNQLLNGEGGGREGVGGGGGR